MNQLYIQRRNDLHSRDGGSGGGGVGEGTAGCTGAGTGGGSVEANRGRIFELNWMVSFFFLFLVPAVIIIFIIFFPLYVVVPVRLSVGAACLRATFTAVVVSIVVFFHVHGKHGCAPHGTYGTWYTATMAIAGDQRVTF